ncbi:hypothetical protein ACGFI9_18900 [Micromonospora sp. NPDC048930]|uniref:hypothetical protein n=1 Tax=Micromonospora sp. NPDC048930 TaxID=3364261 RepID=UPI00371FC330
MRTATTAVAALVAAQVVLAGGFLSGNYEALAVHAIVGSLVMIALLTQLIAAILLWRVGRGPSWPARTSAIQLLVGGALIPLGEQRILVAHVPLAVGLAVGVAFMVVWSWRH